jgi:hypothetical protein
MGRSFFLRGAARNGGWSIMAQDRKPLERVGPPKPPADYLVVETRSAFWYVSREMAKAIEASLDAKREPEWVTFVDLTGARVRLRAGVIEGIFQCTAEQRELERAFHRARQAEGRADSY